MAEVSKMLSANARSTAGYALDVRKPVIEKLGFEGALQHALDSLATHCRKVYSHRCGWPSTPPC